MASRYPEQIVQRDSVAWLTGHSGYREVFADIAAVGARVDTVGVLAGRLLLAEVKVSVGPHMVDHRPDRPSSLESKIAGTLGPLYREEGDALTTAALAAWDRQQPPLIGLIASAYSPAGLEALEAMLNRRSREWLFDHVVWRWNGSSLERLLEAQISTPQPTAYASLKIEPLVGRSARPRGRTLDELEALAGEQRSGDLFRSFRRLARERGLRLQPQRHGLTAAKKLTDRWVTVLGLYLDKSTEVGVNVAISDEIPNIEEGALPGSPGPIAGYLNINRIIANETEMIALFDIAAPTV